MSAKITFSESADLADLKSFLERAKRLDESGVVKFKSSGEVLACYVAPIYSGSLLGDGTTVLGLRTIQLGSGHEIDANFEISAILDRLAKPTAFISRSLELPPTSVKIPWAGITPPREGWQWATSILQSELSAIAKEGIAEVAKILPESIGLSVANKVRQQIWGSLVGSEIRYPKGAAFALSGLGFMQPGEEFSVYQAPGWLRISGQNGHVLCRFSQN